MQDSVASATDAAVDLRRAFRPLAASTWVVTSAHAGVPVGFTAVSVMTASVHPPMLTFTIGRRSSSLDTLRRSRRFAVHLLARDQEGTAHRFAGDASLRFADPATWSWGADGLPVLVGAAARAAGDVASFVEAGDSLLVLGAVESAAAAGPAPLVHLDRAYLSLTPPPSRGATP